VQVTLVTYFVAFVFYSSVPGERNFFSFICWQMY